MRDPKSKPENHREIDPLKRKSVKRDEDRERGKEPSQRPNSEGAEVDADNHKPADPSAPGLPPL